jgi:hypothetical protein
MKAVILYDECEFAKKAQAKLVRADGTTQWSVKPWRIHLLAVAGIADAALLDAADAHLIVLDMGHAAELSPRLLEWLEQWAQRRQIQNAVVAVFDRGNHGTGPAIAPPELSGFAERHGLSLMVGDMGPAEVESAVFVRKLQERELAVTPTLQRIMAEPVQDYYRGWGINE